jgi:hypothetical protein
MLVSVIQEPAIGSQDSRDAKDAGQHLVGGKHSNMYARSNMRK